MAGERASAGADEVVERFRATSGRITGAIALLLAVTVVTLSLIDRENSFPPPVIWAALFGGTLAWAAMLRPRLWATRSHLVMRNMASTVTIPLAAIEQITVRQVVVVGIDEKRYVSPAVGKSWRQALRSDKSRPAKLGATTPYPVFVDDRLHQLAEEARAVSGVGLLSDEQLALASGVRRDWAWPEIVALVVTGVGFVVSFLV